MLNISFSFDENTKTISNMKVTTVTLPDTQYELQVGDNKLIISSEAVSKLGAATGDRIVINYWSVGNSQSYPIISKAGIFDDGSEGNKLGAKRTVSFRGQQRETLLKFGSQFSLEEFIDKTGLVKEGVFKLNPIKEDAEAELVEQEKQLEQVTEARIEDELAELLSYDEEESNDDILPF